MNVSLHRRKGSMTMVLFTFSPRITSNSRLYSLEVWEIVMPRIWHNPWWSLLALNLITVVECFAFLLRAASQAKKHQSLNNTTTITRRTNIPDHEIRISLVAYVMSALNRLTINWMAGPTSKDFVWLNDTFVWFVVEFPTTPATQASINWFNARLLISILDFWAHACVRTPKLLW